jgi:hypothetical protein
MLTHFPFNFQIKILILECRWPSFFYLFYLEGIFPMRFTLRNKKKSMDKKLDTPSTLRHGLRDQSHSKIKILIWKLKGKWHFGATFIDNEGKNVIGSQALVARTTPLFLTFGWQSLNTGHRFYLRLIRRTSWLWNFTSCTTDGRPFKPKKLSERYKHTKDSGNSKENFPTTKILKTSVDFSVDDTRMERQDWDITVL